MNQTAALLVAKGSDATTFTLPPLALLDRLAGHQIWELSTGLCSTLVPHC